MGMRKIRRGDEVVVTAGKYKGTRGTVQRVYPDSRVLVDGVNIVKRHVKPNPQRNISGASWRRSGRYTSPTCSSTTPRPRRGTGWLPQPRRRTQGAVLQEQRRSGGHLKWLG